LRVKPGCRVLDSGLWRLAPQELELILGRRMFTIGKVIRAARRTVDCGVGGGVIPQKISFRYFSEEIRR
jgi:hypothetical protein